MKCPYCGNDKIEEGMRLFGSDGGPVGFRFRKGVISVIAQVHCDVCMNCKAIIKSYMIESNDNHWFK